MRTTSPLDPPSGFPVLSGNPDHPVTDELVAAYRDDRSDDADDATRRSER